MSQLLLIEDNRIVQLDLSQLLRSQNFEVLTARNGNDAFQIIQVFVLDIIIAEIHLPDSSIFELISRVRASSPDYNVPLILINILPYEVAHPYVLRMGAQDYLSKPIDEVLLLDAIARQLN